ncbi:MAG: hypothetical protein AWU57_363 [Marinobacter sp. T13-3]|nr:MAG: hypothetical protein AWU57_363 [Marinobacter sp. T13-3]
MNQAYRFQARIGPQSTRVYVFYDKDRALAKHAEFAEADPRYAPSDIAVCDMTNRPVVIDRNNRFVEHDITGLSLVGTREASLGGAPTDEEWFAFPGTENEVRQQLLNAQRHYSANDLECKLPFTDAPELTDDLDDEPEGPRLG